MAEFSQTHDRNAGRELAYFWGIGDLHYRTIPSWYEFQTQRFALMFADLRELWRAEGDPMCCVSPGDLIEICTEENYTLARATLQEQLGAIPLYPGVGNHEYFDPAGSSDPATRAQMFTSFWGKPLRYSWQVGDIVCIMLDYPNPALLADPLMVFISQETLSFLDEQLQIHDDKPAVIFLHCPLFNTVLSRDPEQQRDYNSLRHFFSPENSQEVRAILARHRNARLFISGHTHSGWEAPNLVVTEHFAEHDVTFVNLMSPWYTGRHKGFKLSEDLTSSTYTPDEPDVIPSFAFHLYQEQITIRVRDHRTRQWLKAWTIPIHTLSSL